MWLKEEKLTGEAVWEESLFDSAKSSLIFEIIEREKSIGDVVAQSLLSYFKQVDHDYNRYKFFHTYTNISVACVDPSLILPLKFISSFNITIISDLELQYFFLLTTLTWTKIVVHIEYMVPVIINIIAHYYLGIVVLWLLSASGLKIVDMCLE